MRGDRAVAEAMLVVVVLALVVGATVPAPATAAQTETPTADNTVTRVSLAANGSATWTVRVRTRLDTEARLAEYETFQERFRANRSRYLGPFRERISGVVANAADLTGREMRAEGFAASTTVQELPRRWGVVTYRFRWTNFSARQGDTLVVGDVFQGGLYLAPNDSLAVEPPAGYELVSVEPEPSGTDSNAPTWVGREDFSDGRPRVAFAASADQPETPTGAVRSNSNDDDTDGGVGDGVLFGGAALVVAVVAGAYTFRRRREPTPGREPSPLAASGDGTADGDETADGDDEAGTSDASGGTDSAADDPESAAEESADSESSPDSPGEILTDAERVRRTLTATGGRMRQADIVEELDWSASKVSRVLAEMDAEGTVEKLKLGRENVIDLADSEE